MRAFITPTLPHPLLNQKKTVVPILTKTCHNVLKNGICLFRFISESENKTIIVGRGYPLIQRFSIP